MGRMASFVLGLGLLAVFIPSLEAVISRGDPVTGYATFYGGPQDGLSPTTPSGGLVNGACGYEALSQQQWPFWNVVSIGPNNPIAYKGNKKGCGYCIEATCQGSGCGANAKPVTLLVTDACDTCAPNQLNLHALVFENNFNSDLSVGQVNVTFQQVDCTPPGNILAKVVKARATEGNYIGFANLAVAGEGTITAVDIKGQTGGTVRMANLYGDVWEASNFGDAPLTITLTDNFGTTLTAPNVITQIAEGTYDTGVQFNLSSQLAPSPQPQPPAPSPAAAGFGSGFVATPSGAFCDQQCFSEGLTSSQFKKIGTTLSTFACGVSDPSVGTVSGYQLSNGSATCSVASPTNAIVSPQYSCLCQTAAQTQGLQPFNGTQCSKACAITIDGLQGKSVAADAQGSSSICVPISETSLLNRFGHTVNTTAGSEACIINNGANQPFLSTQFSCFCLFTAPSTATARHRRFSL